VLTAHEPAIQPTAPQAQYLRDLNRSGQQDAVIQLFEADRLAPTEEVFAQYVRALAKADKLNGTALMQTLYRGAQPYLGGSGGAAALPAAAYAARAAAAEGQAGGSFAAGALRQQGFGLPGLGMASEPAGLASLGGGVAAGGSALGSAKNPIYMMQAEPSFWSQLWRRCVRLGRQAGREHSWLGSAAASPCRVALVLRPRRLAWLAPPDPEPRCCGALANPPPPSRSVRMLGLAFLLMAGLGAMVEERGLSSRGILNNPDLRPQSETATKFADVKGVDEAKVCARM
jgi:ATP-dependent metalloprotease